MRATATDVLPEALDRFRRPALIAGAAGLALCIVGFLIDPVQLCRSYLYGYSFWAGIGLGSLGILMLHHLTGGLWGYTIRRPLEAAAMTLPLMALLFLPIAAGVRSLYAWTDPEVVAHSPLIRHKEAYLNVPFFLGRSAGYFVLWSVLAWLLRRWSLEQDRAEGPAPARRMQALSAPGMVLLFLSVTFAMIDWLMSLEPDWYSTIYGPMLMIGQALTAFSLTTLVSVAASRTTTRPDLSTPDQWNDLGNLMLAFVMLWTYLSFSQYLIIWTGNLAEEVPWYLRRTRGGWQWLAVFIVAFQFALPFVALLFRAAKRRAETLQKVSSLIFVMQLVVTFWLVAPAFGGPFRIHWLDLAAPVGIGGIWAFAFLTILGRHPMVPAKAPIPLAGHHAGVQ